MKIAFSSVPRSRRYREVAGLGLFFLAVVTLASLLSYHAGDPSWANEVPAATPRANLFGWFGANLSEALLQFLGVASFLVPVALGGVAWNFFRGRNTPSSPSLTAGYAVMVASLCALLQLLYGGIAFGGERFQAGGVLGSVLAGGFRAVLATAGAVVLSATLLAASIILTTRFSLVRAAEALGRGGKHLAGGSRRWIGDLPERWRAWRTAGGRKTGKPAEVRPRRSAPTPEVSPTRVARRRRSPALSGDEAGGAKGDASSRREAPGAGEPEPPRQAALPMEPATRRYSLPPLDLLSEPEGQPEEDEQVLLARAGVLTRKLHEFAVDGSVVAIHPGPVVTTFEFKPDPGVKYSRITGLADDLCLGLEAESVRIDRMPGRSTVAVEVPNRRQETIYPWELLGSERFQASRSPLTLALGKDIGGEVFTAELDRMPHLLIAGATGAGKSVALNGMIASILYKATPEQVRFIMIDTKMIELGVYADVPHLLVPVVTDAKKASVALKWAVREMEIRYRKLASVGTRNIQQFNRLLAREPGRTMVDQRTGEEVPLRPLSYIVIVIDEMADLMMVASADVEESVMRLAQMARAVGIHLILATQRPSVDVITGTIKANFPARIAFRVSQRVDSRTIIDQQGAEQLLGRGDMLFLPPGSARLIRIHGGYITEKEIARITTYLRKQAEPVYDGSVLKEPAEDRPGHGGGERDPMFVEAVRQVLREGQCSTTMIQRRLRLGYARAARIVDAMEQEGIVGPPDGSRPRELLAGPEVLEAIEASDS